MAKYREQGNRLYKVDGREIIEVDLDTYDYNKQISVTYTSYNLMNMPNQHSKAITKKKFEKYYNEAMSALHKFHKPKI